MRLLLVHGRAQGGRNKDEIVAEWLAAWDKGLAKAGLARPEGLKVDLPYYGKTLDDLVKEFEVGGAGRATAKGRAADSDFAAFRTMLAEELRENANISQSEVREEMAQGLGPAAAAEKGPENWEWVQAIVRLLDRRLPGTVQSFFERFLKDVYLYINRKAVARKIDAVVRGALNGDTAVVVGHSLGSVVAYNVLIEAAASGDSVPLYITVGSPLGIRGIRDRLATPLSNPVRGWVNYFDDRDVVALTPLDASNFSVDPGVENYPDVDNWTSNRHGIGGYLDDERVARAIWNGLSN